MIARVVPVRRLPNERSWFDYQIHPDVPVTPGQLVTIPFGQKTIQGVVWELLADSDHLNLKTIAAVRQPEPVMTPWQRQALQQVADWYFVSLGTLVVSALPTFLKRDQSDQVLAPPQFQTRSFTPTWNERLWWYRDRATVAESELDWLLKDQAYRAICVPTTEDLDELRRLLGAAAETVGWVDSRCTPKEFRLIYDHVRCGRLKKIIGTGRVFFLPWPDTPFFLLDQEEHPAHRQLEQHPRLDNRQTMALLQPQGNVTTPAPSIATMLARRPSPPSFRGQRRLASLSQPGSHDWITPDAEEFVTSTISQGLQLLVIVPHHGFAQRLACRECGWTLTCPTCHQRVRLTHWKKTTADCGSCGANIPVPLQCPNCRSSRWAVSGLGVDQFIETVRRRWPKVNAQSADQPLSEQAAIIIGTYQAHRLRRSQLKLGPTLVVSGDALLSYPDFAVGERAWTYLARLQADRPDQPVLIQTYEPDLPFWQRWRHGDDRSWYDDEVVQRKKLSLPPLAEHWMVYNPDAKMADLERKRDEVQAALPPTITVTVVSNKQPRRWKKNQAGRLLVQAPIGTSLLKYLDWPKVFPTPWQIDRSLRGWSE